MAEVPKDAEFSFSEVPGAPGAVPSSSPAEIIVSLDDPDFFFQGVLSLPVSLDDAGPVVLIGEALTIATSNTVYRIPDFWSALEAETLRSIVLSDGSAFEPIDFIESFAGADFLEQVIYSIETSSADDILSLEADGILDMRDLTEADIGILDHVSASEMRDVPASERLVPFEPEFSLDRLIAENEAEFGG